MNTYNIYSKKEPSCILFHAVAESESQVKELAKESNISLKGLTIDLQRINVYPEFGKAYTPSIKDALNFK